MSKFPTLTSCLIKKNQECENLKDALKNILSNTINRDFGKDGMYKTGVLMNIKVAVGEDLYNEWIEYYT